MKGMFLIKQELKIEDFYQFQPYLYGPCSFEVYSDLRNLINEGLVLGVPSIRGWLYYKITHMGEEKAKEISLTFTEELIAGIENIKKLVMQKDLFELLKYVYQKYPEYATHSIINIGELQK